MFRPLSRICPVLLCLLLLPGCALVEKRALAKRRASMEKALKEARQRPLLMGRITVVNAGERFVLIDATSAPTPRAGTLWRAYSSGAVSAELRATGISRRPWVIADIVSGEPHPGDQVLQPAEAEPAVVPRATEVPRDKPPATSRPFWRRWLGLGH